MTRRRDKEAAQGFEAALAASDETHPEFGPLVRLSGVLQPAKPLNQTRRAQTKDLMLRAFDVARGGVAPPIGLVPPIEPPTGQPAAVYTATAVLAEEGVIYLADVESITEDRAAQVAQTVLACERTREV